MKFKAMLMLTLAAFVTGCSPSTGVTTATTGTDKTNNNTAAQTTSSGKGTTQAVTTTVSTTTQSSTVPTVPATIPTTTTSSEPLKAELGKPIVFDGFEITINSIKKLKDKIVLDYTFVNRKEEAFSPSYMVTRKLVQDNKPLMSTLFSFNDDQILRKRWSYVYSPIKKDVPINLLEVYLAESDTPVTLELSAKMGQNQKAEPLVLDLSKKEFKVSEISPEVSTPAGVKFIADNVPALKVGEVLDLDTMKLLIDGIYSMKDSQGIEGVMLEYTRTLNSNELNYQADFVTNTFQNGKALSSASINASAEVMNAVKAGSAKLLPGISVKGLLYKIIPDDKADLEFEFNEWKDLKPVKRISIKTTIPTEKITIAQLEEKVKVANATNNAAAKAFVPQTEDRSLIDKKMEFKGTELTINNIRTAKNDDKVLILDITYNNKSTGLNVVSAALIVVYQNGVEINRNFNFKDPNDQKLNNNLSSKEPNKPVEGILSYQMNDSSMVVIEIYEVPESGKEVSQKQLLVIKP